MRFESVLFCALFAANSALQGILKKVARGHEVNLGLIKDHVEIGHQSVKYGELTKSDKIVTDNIRSALETARIFFPTGSKWLPPLDPYQKSLIKTIHFNWMFATGDISLTNIIIAGAKYFLLHELETRLKGFRLDFDLSMPNVSIAVNHTLQMVVGIFPYNKMCNSSMRIMNTNVRGALSAHVVQHNNLQVLQLKGISVFVTSDGVTAKVTGLSGFKDLIGLVDMPANLIPKLVHKMLVGGAKGAMNMANDILTNIPAHKIMDAMLEENGIMLDEAET